MTCGWGSGCSGESCVALINVAQTTITDGAGLIILDMTAATIHTFLGTDLSPTQPQNGITVNTSGLYEVLLSLTLVPSGAGATISAQVIVNTIANALTLGFIQVKEPSNVGWNIQMLPIRFYAHFNKGDVVKMAAQHSNGGGSPGQAYGTLTVKGPIIVG
jgi:hypothetical protein